MHAGDPGRLNGHVKDVKVGFSLHIHVAETDAQALEQARPAFDLFAHNFTYRYVRRGDTQRYANREDYDDQLAHGRILVGSPATVRARLRAAGVGLRPPRSGQRSPTVAEVSKMRGTGLTVRELARHFGVSHVTILDRLKKAKR